MHGLDWRWARMIHADRPLGDVDVMGTPIGQLPPRVLVPPAELVVAACLEFLADFFRHVVDLGSLAEPHVPVEALGRRHPVERLAGR